MFSLALFRRPMTTARLFARRTLRPAVLPALLLTAAASVTAPVTAATPAAPPLSNGVFTDKDGARHPWSITPAHTLFWDDRPFVPVGGRFQAKSWSPAPKEADFEADVAALALLKQNGISDLYLQPARVGITAVPPAAIQRLLDHLDANGFTYGISLNDGPQEILVGYDVRPGKYRHVAPEDGGNLRFPIESVADALYFLVPEKGGEIVQTGKATMVEEGARVTVAPIPGKYVVFLLPQKVYFSGASVGVPNLWEGFDNYRDNVIALFRQVKPGKGFRFFLDALPSSLSETEAFESFLPTSVAFATEWGEWLAKKYKSIDNLQNAWAMSDRELADFRGAANLVPLWGGGKGIEVLYDRTNGRPHKVVTTRSEFWKDLNAFKTESVRDYMNDLATALKRAVADVPVVYRSRGYSGFFTKLPVGRGFDGIGIEAYGRGEDLVTRSAGYVYAQAAEAPKTVWTLVTGTGDAAPAYKKAVGYPSRTVMHSDLDWLREIGARGFFVDGVRVADPRFKLYDLSSEPTQLQWLAEYAQTLTATGVRDGEKLPTALFYPRGLLAASLRPLEGGGWWLPTDRPGVVYDFGSTGRAYSMADKDDSVVYYLWNPAGKRTIHIKIPKASRAPDASNIRWSVAANGSVRNGVLTLTIGPDPVRLENFPAIPVPTEAFGEVCDEAKKLIAAMKTQKQYDAGRYEIQLTSIKARYNADSPLLSIAEALRLIEEVRGYLRPYLWVEAEEATSHSFDQADEQTGASGSIVLRVESRAVHGLGRGLAGGAVVVPSGCDHALRPGDSAPAFRQAVRGRQPDVDSDGDGHASGRRSCSGSAGRRSRAPRCPAHHAGGVCSGRAEPAAHQAVTHGIPEASVYAMSSLFRAVRDYGGLRLTESGNPSSVEEDEDLSSLPPGMMQTIAAAQRILETMTPEQKEIGWQKIQETLPPGEAEEAAIGIALEERITYDEARYMLLAMMIAGAAATATGHDLPFKSPSASASLRPMEVGGRRKKSKGRK
jgi:hypothetical protein